MSKTLLNLISKTHSLTNKRYVNTFVPLVNDVKEGKKTDLNDEEKELLQSLENSAKNIQRLSEKHSVIKEINEKIYMEVLDHKNLTFWIDIQNGEVEVSTENNSETKPTFHVPLYAQNILNLERITNHEEIDLNEVYRITRVLFLPFLQGLYNGDYSDLPKDKSYLELDNFIHVEVKAPTDIHVEGFEGPAKATVVNVDGQWLMFEGFQGDPDIKYEMDIKQALMFAYILRVKLVGGAKSGKTFLELKGTVDEYNKLKKEVTTYERNWHTIEEYVER